MTRPPAFPPSSPRQRPQEVEAELRRLARREAIPDEASAAPARGRKDPQAPVGAPLQEASPVREPAFSLQQRLAELRGARRRARLRTLGIAGGVVALLAIGVWLIVFSPVFAFKVEELTVRGTSEFVTRDDVIEVMTPHEGTPLLRLDLQVIAANLEENYAVKGVEFERSWPSGLAVTLTARVAVAATPLDSGFMILDGDGVELGQVPEAVPGLPVIELTHDDDGLADTIIAVLHVMDALPAELLERVTDVGARTSNDVRFTLDDGAEVIWGSAEESELKSSVLQVLLQAPAKVYNVSTPMTPITS